MYAGSRDGAQELRMVLNVCADESIAPWRSGQEACAVRLQNGLGTADAS